MSRLELIYTVYLQFVQSLNIEPWTNFSLSCPWSVKFSRLSRGKFKCEQAYEPITQKRKFSLSCPWKYQISKTFARKGQMWTSIRTDNIEAHLLQENTEMQNNMFVWLLYAVGWCPPCSAPQHLYLCTPWPWNRNPPAFLGPINSSTSKVLLKYTTKLGKIRL